MSASVQYLEEHPGKEKQINKQKAPNKQNFFFLKKNKVIKIMQKLMSILFYHAY